MKTDLSPWLAAGGLLLALLFGPAAPARAQNQTCIDNAVIACFDGCSDPTTFQECIIGCATGANLDPQNCADQCFNDPVCLERCTFSITTAQACLGATQQVAIVQGAIALNRRTGVWQQTVRLTNETLLETMDNLVLVAQSLAPGWTLANADGTTQLLPPVGSPYRNVVGPLRPGQSVTVVLQFTRAGTPAFAYKPVVYIADGYR